VSLWEDFNTFQQALPTNFDSINEWWVAANKSVPKESRSSFNENGHIYHVECLEGTQSLDFLVEIPIGPAGGR